jgi:arsenate reductase (thioredoxin)
MHVHVAVKDLRQATGFYSALFDAEPVVVKPDYAKWMLDDPRVNFAISTRGREPGLDHLGVQVEDKSELHEVYTRLRKAGGAIVEQGDTSCCYAKSEKSWIDDPAGISWETFHTTGEATDYGDGTANALPAWRTPNPAARRTPPHRKKLRQTARDRVVVEQPLNVLFLCTGNSARSIIAEAILNKVGAGRFRAYSAGSRPKGRVNPNTIALLRGLGYDTSPCRSKSWNEFTKPGALEFDFVFTVCDNAAAETCPLWPGQPMTAHWGIPDPAEAKGNPAEIALAFKDAYRMLAQRIGIFVSLPIRSLSLLSLQKRLGDIGRMEGAAAKAAKPT